MDLAQIQQYLPLVIGVVLVAYAFYKDHKKDVPPVEAVKVTPKLEPVTIVEPKTISKKIDFVSSPNVGTASLDSDAPSIKDAAKIEVVEPAKKAVEDVNPKDVEADKAKNTLLAAGVKGTELLQTLVAVRRGEITAKDVEDAHKPVKAEEAK
jgi:hypothetical protein